MKLPFKHFNRIGFPLCTACGCNPRKKTEAKCGTCLRHDRPIKWDRMTDDVRREMESLGQVEPKQVETPDLFTFVG